MASEKRVQQPWPGGPSPDRLGEALPPKLQVQGTLQLHASLTTPRMRQEDVDAVPAAWTRTGLPSAAAASSASTIRRELMSISSDSSAPAQAQIRHNRAHAGEPQSAQSGRWMTRLLYSSASLASAIRARSPTYPCRTRPSLVIQPFEQLLPRERIGM